VVCAAPLRLRRSAYDWQGWLITAIAVGGAVGALAGVQKTAGEILLVGVVGLYLALAFSLGGTKRQVVTDSRASGSDDDPSLRTVPRK